MIIVVFVLIAFIISMVTAGAIMQMDVDMDDRFD